MTANAAARRQAKSAKSSSRAVSRSTSTGGFVTTSVGRKHPSTTTQERAGTGTSSTRTAAAGGAAVSGAMPQTAVRTGFLIEALGSGAEVARLLGVNRSQPSQWRSGKEAPSARAARQLLDLDYVMAKALQIWPAEAALEWFHGSNDHLDGARPIDVLKLRGTTEVVKALDVEMA